MLVDLGLGDRQVKRCHPRRRECGSVGFWSFTGPLPTSNGGIQVQRWRKWRKTPSVYRHVRSLVHPMTTEAPAPVRPSRFTALRGCHYQRISPDKILVWRQIGCANCGESIAGGDFEAPSAEDSDLAHSGLIRWEGAMPTAGILVMPLHPLWCERCAQAFNDRVD